MPLLQVLLFIVVSSTVRSDEWPTEGSCEPCQCSLQSSPTDGLFTHVDCSGLHLLRLPKNLPDDLESLDLSFNALDTAEINSVCKFDDLQFLSLAYNPLTLLDGSPFLKCSSLVKLNLTGSGVFDLYVETFTGLENVQEIYGLVSEYATDGAFENIETLVILEFTFIGDGLQEGMFKGLQVETMDLTLFEVTNVPRRLFQFGDATLQFLDVYGPHVTNIHGALLRGLDVLREVSLNLPKLTRLPERLFVNFGADPFSNPPRLRQIRLRGMQIIPEKSFEYLASVVRLVIHDVQDIAVRGLFDHMINLEVLNLTGCNILRLPPGWFEMLESLKTLDISNTTLRSLDEDAFYGPTNLSIVDLSMNALRQLGEYTFEPLRLSIRWLSFRSNILKTLEGGILREMVYLQYLDLSDNKLSEISPDIFSNLTGLIDLRLHENKFYNLPKNVFRDQHVLETLHLGVNYFSRIPVAVTSYTISLRVLRLANNKIVNIPISLHDDLPHLEYLSLLDNPVFCQCEVFSQRIYLPNLFIDAICASPVQHYRRHVMDIEVPKECHVPILKSTSNLVKSLLSTKPHSHYGSDGNGHKTDDISEGTDIVGDSLEWTYSALNPSVITSGHADDDDSQSRLSPASTEVNVHPSESVPAQSVMTTGYTRELTSFRIVTEPIASEMRHRSTDGVVVVPSAVSEVVAEVAPTSTPRSSPTLVPSTSHDADHVGRGTLERPHGKVVAEEGEVIMKNSYAEAISFGFLAFVIPVILAAIVLLIWYKRHKEDQMNVSVTASGTIVESRSEISQLDPM